ncbi:MAG: penicillin-binding protein 2 [Deltaproteobacteria bacterium]|nr:penicillin-binding protein 2 [Deltaproteobacteria bacterium]
MLDFPQEGVKELSRRFVFCYVALGVALLFILLRLFVLQIVRGDFFWILSSEHTVKEIRIPAARGLILDRKKRVLVENRPSFDLAVIPQYVRDRKLLKESLMKLTGISGDLFDFRWRWVKELPPFYPLRIWTDLPYDLAAKLKVMRVTANGLPDSYDLRGVEIIPRPLRRHPSGFLAALTFGYLSEVSPETFKKLQSEFPNRYWLGDLVGSSGLEGFWESSLKGEDGVWQKLVNAIGQEISGEEVQGLLKDIPPRQGADLVLSIDKELQETAEFAFQQKSGALVLLDIRNGEVLALVSRPSFDPAELTTTISSDRWKSLVADPAKIFLHRALQPYPPGSTYKIVTAIAALEEKVIRPDEKLYCGGGMRFGGRFFRCWREGGHGSVSLHEALVQSCDTFFYELGLRLGADRLAKYAHYLGLGEKTGIDLWSEKEGLIPTEEWKKKAFGEPWYAGENLSIAVGQGSVLVTPLQSARMMAIVANGGRSLRPHLAQSVQRDEGEIQAPFFEGEQDVSVRIPVSEENLSLVRAALADVVATPQGTAYGSRSSLVAMGGKTGTAQVISEEAKKRVGGTGRFEDHAWFVAFAPVSNPQIAVAVLVEHGGFGAQAAAPIAKVVVEKFMQSASEGAVRE